MEQGGELEYFINQVITVYIQWINKTWVITIKVFE